MRHKTYMTISSLIFLIVAIMHLYRAFRGWDLQLGDWQIAPFWSWIGGIIALYLAYQGYRHNRR